MTKISVMPKETLAELLLYLADNESFTSVTKNLGEGITVEETRAALRELARELSREAMASRGSVDEAKEAAHLSRKAKEIMSYLSPNEEKALLSAFGLAEK